MRRALLLAAGALLAVTACEPVEPPGPSRDQMINEARLVVDGWARSIAAGDFQSACWRWTGRGYQDAGRYCAENAGRMSGNDVFHVRRMYGTYSVTAADIDDGDCRRSVPSTMRCASMWVASQWTTGSRHLTLLQEFDGWKIVDPWFYQVLGP